MARLVGSEIIDPWFVAKITEIGTASAPPCDGVPHAWVALQPCDTLSNYKAADTGYSVQSGTLADNPAYAIDGTAASVDDIVLMRFRGVTSDYTGTSKVVMEFIKRGGSGNTMACPHVSSVQCTGGLLVVTYDTECVSA